MKANEYRVLERAVEDGVAYAITRVFKYETKSRINEEQLREKADTFVQNIMGTICEWFDFPDPSNSPSDPRVIDTEDV